MVLHFFKDESGVETMEWIAIIAVTAVLIGIAVKCAKAMQKKLTTAVKHI